MQQAAKYIIISGIILLFIGLIFYFAGNKFNWLGRLPGDIKIEKDNFKFYFPITTMLIISALLSLIVGFFKLFK